jgi:hypothetical protein
MTITAALAALAPYGITSIEVIDATMTPLWRVIENGKVYSYCVTLEQLVQCLTPQPIED